MLSLIDRWFEPVRASQNYLRQDYVLLFLLLATGAWLRFWHLGDVGLHGDEDILGLAARGIVAHGIPILPSDLVYLRAPLHTYLLAGSTLLFGDTEWALRLPSAIVGSFCGLFAFFLGKRFLDPKPNLAFVALVTFLPAMLEISQTARMYVFLVASLLVFGIFLLRWERNGTPTTLLLAFLALLLAVQFHQLAVFAAPILLYPGLANRSWKQLILGTAGVGGTVLFSVLIGLFAHQDYPEASERLVWSVEEKATPLQLLLNDHGFAVLAVTVVTVVAVFLLGTVRVVRRRAGIPATLLLAVGAASCLLLHYHIGMIALFFGCIMWLRTGFAKNWRLVSILAAVGLMAIAQFFFLDRTAEFPGRSIIGAFVGFPSIWPTLQFAAISPVAAALFMGAIVFAGLRIAKGRKVPVYFLFFGISVWAPLFVMGMFTWYAATRYVIGPLPYFLMVALAGNMYLIGETAIGNRLQAHRPMLAVAAFATIVAMVNPAAAWQVAQNSYEYHSDHEGAAAFVNSLESHPMDLVIAEDSIVQTYYLGKVDFRLQNVANARKHSFFRNGVLYGQYTGTPVIGSGEELQVIFNDSRFRNIYIISNSQGAVDWLRRNRENGIAEVLNSGRLEIIYVGRDKETVVWKLRRPSSVH